MTRDPQIIHESFDVIIIGGGLAGVCAAIASARQGMKTVLIQNRPVLGGNSSGEIGVPPHGADQAGDYRHVRETGIIDEIATANAAFPNHLDSPSIWSTVLWAICRDETNLTVHLNAQAGAITMKVGHIASIRAEQQTTEKVFEFTGKVFIDCSGDGILGYRAGAEFMTGRESRERFGELMAQEKADDYRMGNSVYIRARNVGYEVPFPTPHWVHVIPSDDALPDKGLTCPHPVEQLSRPRGGWWWIETGGTLDTISDAETIRDELYRYAIGVWDHLKNRGTHGAENYVLESIVALPGKRDSRRFVGDYILIEPDIRTGRVFEDAVAYGGWHIDVHQPYGIADKMYWYGKLLNGIYTIPYRSLYSTNVPNLLFAGRNLSASHVAFGSVRVMLTCALMGQAVGNAAALCIKHGCQPRDIYSSHLKELQQELLKQDCYIPGVRDETTGNLARSATITASSESELTAPEPTVYHPLNIDRAQLFILSEEKLNRVSLPLENTSEQPITLTIHLRAAKRIDDFTSRDDLATATAQVPPGRSQVAFDFNIDLPGGNRPYWIHLPAQADLAWGYSAAEVPAAQAGAYKEQYFTQPGSEWFMHRTHGTYGFTLEPASCCYAPEQVISGVSRPGTTSNLWVSGPGLPQWLELSWKNPISVSELHLTFDHMLDRTLANWAKQGPASTLARDYTITLFHKGEAMESFCFSDNIHRKRVHRFPQKQVTSIRITVERTWGENAARIFEVRTYQHHRQSEA